MNKTSTSKFQMTRPVSKPISDLHQVHVSTEQHDELPSHLKVPFSVKWMPNVYGFSDFIQEYRRIIGVSLGGSRNRRYDYTERTISEVLSVGAADDLSSLPQRISLSNFHLGPPITSYGCIYRYKQLSKEPHYLLIQRKDSVSYIDLIHGNYRESQLYFMLQDISEEERKRILNYDYPTLWEDLHLKAAEGESFEYGLSVFEKIKPYLKELFVLIPPSDPLNRNLWLFPKGKINWKPSFGCSSLEYGQEEESWDEMIEEQTKTRVNPEAPFDCAIREFKEETNGLDLLKRKVHLAFADPVVERYLGSNSKNYQTDYFVFNEVSEEPLPELTPFPIEQTSIRKISKGEVQQMKWVPFSELPNYLRPERQELVEYIENNISNEIVDAVSAHWRVPADMNEVSFENNE
jgi:ADP-ribose pyrophosphatase YjhB (NUDIX family)